MRVEREHDRIRLILNSLEAQIFEQVLRLVLENYKLKPAELDPKGGAAWYSTRGCQTAGMSVDETNDWIESLHGFKSAQVGRLEEWIAKLAARQSTPVLLEFSFAEAASLITILNDHRLLVAARHEIGQREMDLHSLQALKTLGPAQQNAVCEIHFLAWVIENLLRFTAPEASTWMEGREESSK
jgi:hypothetical protein